MIAIKILLFLGAVFGIPLFLEWISDFWNKGKHTHDEWEYKLDIT